MDKHNLDRNLDNFLRHLESLKDTFPMSMLLLDPYHRKANKEFEIFIKKNVDDIEDEEGNKFIGINYEDKHTYDRLHKSAYISGIAQKIIPQSLFVSLISQYDSFLNQLLRLVYQIKPEILNSSQKNLTFSEMVELGTLENARDYIIEKEVESVLRESHTYHFEYLENKLGERDKPMTLRKKLPIWSTFIEVTERRNLFVHCDGIVSSQYIKNCEKNNVDEIDKIKVGDKLRVTPEYFIQAYRCLFEISTKLTHTIWRKLLKGDLENADKHLNHICFDLICSSDFVLADILLEFACEQPRHFNDTTCNILLVNQALSKHLNKKENEARSLISSKDWSASSDEFKLAYNVILGNDEIVFSLMKKIGKNGDVSKGDYKIWPLFTNYRKREDLKKTFKEIFGEEYTISEKPLSPLQQILKKEVSKRDKSKKITDKKTKPNSSTSLTSLSASNSQIVNKV